MRVRTYTSDLTKCECVRRLEKHTGRDGWPPWEEGTISAKIRGDRFRLFAWGPANLWNSFAPRFYGRLHEDNGKTHIRGRYRMLPIVEVFLAMWFGGLAVMAALILLLPSTAWGTGRQPSAFAVVGAAVGMMLLGYGMVLFGRRLARGQSENLQSFLARVLKAQPLGEKRPNTSTQPSAQKQI
jgi:hypothetical protein